jgi:para-nitrobenzyl esterase
MEKVLTVLALAAMPLAAAIQPPVRTDLGLVSGVPGSNPSIVAFRGIPFAAPPVGALRWRAPKPASPWQGTRKAEEFSASCIQNIGAERKPWTYEFLPHNAVSEDCLYLNIWTPAKTAGDKLPVFVWIHGGGLTEGSTAVPLYDGEGLARKGLVVVTINYRLGALGFLAHPELTRESDRNSSGNYGLLDQLAALEWVHRNVAAFGGDPGRVTIAGQSAGARSVHCLSASPLAKGLFHRAIAESGSGVGRLAAKALREAESDGVKFAESKGAHSLADLRAKPWRELLAAPASGPAIRFGVTLDGWFLPEDVDETIAKGKQNDVPMITGMTADEGSSAADYGAIPAAEWQKQVRERFGDLAGEFLKLYPAGNAEQARDSQISSAREQTRVSIYLWARNRQKTGKSNLYTYWWDHPEPGPDKARYGAFHSSEVPYVLNSLGQSGRPWGADDRKIAEAMSSYWANFARTGDPNGQGLPAWASFRETDPSIMELGDSHGPRAVADRARLDFFTRYFANPR